MTDLTDPLGRVDASASPAPVLPAPARSTRAARHGRRLHPSTPASVRAEVDAVLQLTCAAHLALTEMALLLRRLEAAAPAAVPDLLEQVRVIAAGARHEDVPLLDGTLAARRLDVGPIGQPITVHIPDVTTIVEPLNRPVAANGTAGVGPEVLARVVDGIDAAASAADVISRRLQDALVLLDLAQANGVWTPLAVD